MLSDGGCIKRSWDEMHSIPSQFLKFSVQSHECINAQTFVTNTHVFI